MTACLGDKASTSTGTTTLACVSDRLQRHPSSSVCLLSFSSPVRPLHASFLIPLEKRIRSQTPSAQDPLAGDKTGQTEALTGRSLSRSCRGPLLFADYRSRHKQDRSAAGWATCRGDAGPSSQRLRKKRNWKSDSSRANDERPGNVPQPTGKWARALRTRA